jgi:hypothetical protein
MNARTRRERLRRCATTRDTSSVVRAARRRAWFDVADAVAEQLGEVLHLDVKAFAVPRAGWAKAFEQFRIAKGHTGPAEEMFEAVNAGWMDLGVEGTEHVAGTMSARDVFAAAQKAMTS